ncbi:hypothetical protein B566_EDAN008682 [Ephemera danica]|nr:hypothetical protein B566_EDAN008682 [Ephemera danica]
MPLIGYTATVYRNEDDIGRALKELFPKYGLERKDIFLTSKLAPGDHGLGRVRQALRESLSKLGTSYLDLYLVHWPGVGRVPASSPGNQELRAQTWAELEQLQREGLVKSIGVSNYTERHLCQLLASCTIVPAVNQVELHPHYPQQSLIKFCNERGIHVQAYSSLGGHSAHVLLADSVVKDVATQTGKTVPQVLLRWALQQGIGVIPKSEKPDRIMSNFDLDFTLSPSAMEALSSLKKFQKYAWDPTDVA